MDSVLSQHRCSRFVRRRARQLNLVHVRDRCFTINFPILIYLISLQYVQCCVCPPDNMSVLEWDREKSFLQAHMVFVILERDESCSLQCFETDAPWQRRHNLHCYQCETVLSELWVQHLSRRRLGRKPPPLATKDTQQKTFNELNVFQLARIITIPAQVYHYNPLHDYCSPSLIGESDKTLQQGATQLTAKSKLEPRRSTSYC